MDRAEERKRKVNNTNGRVPFHTFQWLSEKPGRGATPQNKELKRYSRPTRQQASLELSTQK